MDIMLVSEVTVGMLCVGQRKERGYYVSGVIVWMSCSVEVTVGMLRECQRSQWGCYLSVRGQSEDSMFQRSQWGCFVSIRGHSGDVM